MADLSNSKNNSQLLKDRLNKKLKQRLEKAQGTDTSKQAESIEVAEDAVVAESKKNSKKEAEFLEELESQTHVAIENFGDPVLEAGLDSAVPSLHTMNALKDTSTPPPSHSGLRKPKPLAKDNQPDAEETTHAEPAEPQAMDGHEPSPGLENSGPSLANMLKKPQDASKGSILKAPRQSQQAAENEHEPPKEPVAQEPALAQRPSQLRSPRKGAQPQAELAEEPKKNSHEIEIIEAVGREDERWIADNAKFDGLSTESQELILTAALSRPSCIKALIDAGLIFDGKKGLAVLTAIKSKNYPALDVLKTRGAILGIEELKAIAHWRRTSATHEAATPPQAFEEPTQTTGLDNIAEGLDAFLAAEGSAPSSQENLESLEISEEPPLEEGSAELHREEAAEPAKENELARQPEAADKTTNNGSSTAEAAASVTEDNAMQQDIKKTPAATAPSGMSAVDRARLAMLDKIVAEKQQLEAQKNALEMRVMELEAFEQAAAELEQELAAMGAALDESKQESESLRSKIEEMQATYANIDGIVSGHEKRQLELEAALAAKTKENAKISAAAEAESLALSKSNGQLAQQLEALEATCKEKDARIESLETREAPPPEAVDWLEGTDRERRLKKDDMFIATIVAGEADSEVLAKVALNTGVDAETAGIGLAIAAENGRIDYATWILDSGDATAGFGGELPLIRAIKSKNAAMINFLTSRGANIHHADEFALRMAVAMDDPFLIDKLVAAGSNPMACGQRALREAASAQKWSCFKALLAYGASGLDDKGSAWDEIRSAPEAMECMQWLREQRKLAKAIDPAFATRAGLAQR